MLSSIFSLLSAMALSALDELALHERKKRFKPRSHELRDQALHVAILYVIEEVAKTRSGTIHMPMAP